MKLQILFLLIPFVSTQQCVDTEKWSDNKGKSCSTYAGFCSSYQFKPGFETYAGAINNFPELNCCSCGKKKLEDLPEYLPSEIPNMCVHTLENSKSIYVATRCQILSSEEECT